MDAIQKIKPSLAGGASNVPECFYRAILEYVEGSLNSLEQISDHVAMGMKEFLPVGVNIRLRDGQL